MGRKCLKFNRHPWSWMALFQTHASCMLAECNLNPLCLMHFFACFIICRYAVPESPFSVPVKVGSQELNELISSLLSSNGTYKYNIIMAPSILNFSLSQGGGGGGGGGRGHSHI